MKDKLNGFKIPEKYLDNFTPKLLEKLAQEKNLKRNRDGFVVPDAYFDTLYQSIATKIEHTPKVVQLQPFKKYYYAGAVAAVIAFLFAITNTNTNTAISFEDIAISDIENYLYHEDLDFSTYELAEMIPVDELEIKDIVEHELNNEQIINYIDESIDTFEELNLDPDE